MSKTTAVVLFTCSLLVLVANQAAAQAPRKPNVLVIISDDLNTKIGCYGSSSVLTPNIDAFAKTGVRFDRAYCQYPQCNASRTSFLSGRRPETTKILDNETFVRDQAALQGVTYLPAHFRNNGYFTARVGKVMHPHSEGVIGWDVSEDTRSRGGASESAGRTGPTRNDDSQEPDGMAALRIIELLAQKRDKPFFIVAGFHRPHVPMQAPRKYFDLYPRDQLTFAAEPNGHDKNIPAIAMTRQPLRDIDKRREINQGYNACVSFMDAQVGLVLDSIDRLQLSEDTIVVMMSDHGWHLGEHGGLMAKLTLFDESTRVPLIVRAPGLVQGKASARLVELVDLFPTLADLCDLPIPDGLEGVSFKPLLSDPILPWKKAAYTVVTRAGGILGRAVHTERYRYTEWGEPKTAELYDLVDDPHEYVNLVRDEKHVSVLPELQSLLSKGWQSAVPESVKLAHNVSLLTDSSSASKSDTAPTAMENRKRTDRRELSRAAKALKDADKNNDGRLSRDEFPQKDIFSDIDKNDDGFATREEIQAYYAVRRSEGANKP